MQTSRGFSEADSQQTTKDYYHYQSHHLYSLSFKVILANALQTSLVSLLPTCLWLLLPPPMLFQDVFPGKSLIVNFSIISQTCWTSLLITPPISRRRRTGWKCAHCQRSLPAHPSCTPQANPSRKTTQDALALSKISDHRSRCQASQPSTPCSCAPEQAGTNCNLSLPTDLPKRPSQ